jgi:hypothetical protein
MPASAGEPNPASSAGRGHSPELDAINLMLRDLHTRHEEIRHRASFRGCTRELMTVQQELVNHLLAKRNRILSISDDGLNGGKNYNSIVS